MKRIICFTASILFAALLYGQTVSVAKTAVSIGSKSGDKVSFDVTATSYWGLYDLPTWLATDTAWFNGNKTVTLYAAANPLYSTRVDTIKVYWFDASYTNYYETAIVVTQQSTGSGLSRNALSFSAAKGSTDTFSIRSSYYWEIQNLPSWLSLNKNYVTGNAAITATATEENPLYTSRSANFKVIRATSATTADTAIVIATQAASTYGVSSNLVVVAAAEGSKAQFDVKASGAWTVSSKSSLFTISPKSGSGNDTVHITATANTNAYYKADSVYVTFSGGKKLLVLVAQQPASAYCNSNPSAMNFGAWEGSSVSATISSNSSWGIAKLPKWLTTDTLWGYGDSSFTLTATKNTVTKQRRDTALLYWFDGNNLYYSKQLVFTQSAAEFGLSTDSLIFTSDKNTKALYVTANDLWQFADGPAWATYDANWKSSSDSVRFTVEANPLSVNRVGNISFYRYSGNSIVDTLTLVLAQAAATNGVSDTLVAFSAAATETQKIAIAASASWTVSSKPQWISLAKASGTGNDTLRISALANSETYYRRDTIKLLFGTKLVRIVVLQNPTAATLSLSTKQINITATGGSTTLKVNSNTNWSAFIKASWLNADSIWGYKDSNITITAQENIQMLQRTDTILVAWTKDGEYTEEKVAVVQAAATSGISKSAITLEAAAGSTDQLTVTSTSRWEIVNIPLWATVDNNNMSSNALVTITATENQLSSQRTATMQFRRYYTNVDYYTTDITITQKAAASGVEKTAFNIGATAGSTAEVAFSGTASVVVSDAAAWLSSTVATNKITFTAVENPSTSVRVDTLLLTFSNGQKTRISITQAASVAKINLSSNAVAFAAAAASTARLTITSNAEWGITGLPTWITADTLWATGSYTLTFTAQENTATSVRSTSFTLYWYDENQNYFDTIVSVQQAGVGLSLLVSPQQLSVAAAGIVQSVAITSNVLWTISNTNSWIAINNSTGSNNGTVLLTVAPNTSTKTRSASISVAGNGVSTQTISVAQAAAAAQLSISTTAYQTAASADQFLFTVRSNVAWTIAASTADWVHFSKASGSDTADITVTINQNTSIQSRTATISISADGLSTQTITLTQSGAIASLVTSENALSFGNGNESKTISVTANVSWTINTSASWISFNKTGASGNANVTVTADSNKTTTSRSASIVVTASNGLSKTISVTQLAGAAYISVSTQAISAKATETSASFTVDGNVAYTISAESGSWASVGTASGTGSQTISVSFAANKETTSRSTTITISATGVASKKITITQAAASPYFVISTTAISVEAVANKRAYLLVSANQSWIVSTETSWITPSKTSATGTDTVYFTVTENTDINSRTGYATLTAKDGTQKLVILTQAATATVLDLSTTWIETGYSASNTGYFTINSNNTWNVVSKNDWLTLETTSGIDTALVYMDIAANNADTSRIATIEITAADGTVAYVFIRQAGYTTDVAETNALSVQFYPNPVELELHVAVADNQIINRIAIASLAGAVLTEQTPQNGEATVSVDNLPAGTYMVTVTCNGQTISKPIVKK